GIRDKLVTGVQTCALPICYTHPLARDGRSKPARYFSGSPLLQTPPFLNRPDILVVARLGPVIDMRAKDRLEFARQAHKVFRPPRSEERRVGKEGRYGGGVG